jgi:4-hydroxy-tetrahydrodipicolinate synthase
MVRVMKTIDLAGAYTALVTPFNEDASRVDEAALEALVEAQIAGGIAGLVPVGTTGESPTLDADEAKLVIKSVVKAARGRVPVLAGTGSNSTKKTVEASKAAVDAGADAVMVVMPYYNKPSQDGMCEHVLAVARAVSCPVVLYNIPGRSVVDLGADTTLRIAEQAANVVGVKDATGNVLRCQELKRRAGDRLSVMSGDDALTLPMMAAGASGVISVTSNVRPREVSEVTRRFAAGDLAGARSLHYALLELHAAMFLEPNPAPAKAALALEGKMSRSVRGPLLPASPSTEEKVRAALAQLVQGVSR